MSDQIQQAEDALAAVKAAVAADDDTRLPLRLCLRIEELMTATEQLVAECKRALDEGDWG